MVAAMYFEVPRAEEFDFDNHVVLLTQPSCLGDSQDPRSRMPVLLDQDSLRMWLETGSYTFLNCAT